MNYASFRNIKPFLITGFIFLLLVEAIGAGFARRGTGVDFQTFYVAGSQLRSHPSRMYDLALQEQAQHAITSGFVPFYHPSYEALLFAPFSFLNYRSAYLSFLAFGMLLLMGSFFTVQPALSTINPVWQPRSGVLLFVFFPLLVAFVQGQDSVLSLLLYCLAWRQLESGKDRSAGCLLALALFKFQFALPLAILISIRRGWRFAAGFLLASCGILLLCVLIVGWAGATDYVHLISGETSVINRSIRVQQFTPDPRAMPNIAGLIYACGGRFLASSAIFNVLSGMCSLAVFAWCARAVRRVEIRTAFAIAVLGSLLVSYHFCLYDLTLMLLPIALLASRTNKYFLASIFALPAIVVLGLGVNWNFLLAVPILALLVYTIAMAPKEAVPATQPVPA